MCALVAYMTMILFHAGTPVAFFASLSLGLIIFWTLEDAGKGPTPT